MLVGFLVLGVALGGSFLGGIALGKSQEDEVTQTAPLAQTAPTQGFQAPDQDGGQTLAGIRERIQSGEISQEELSQLRQRFQDGGGAGGGGFAGPGGGFAGADGFPRFGQGAQGGGGAGFLGGRGFTGIVEKIDGSTLTLNTLGGILQATFGTDTVIQQTVEVSIDDLVEGMRLVVNGETGEDGTVQARTIFVIPEDAGGFREGGLGLPERPTGP